MKKIERLAIENRFPFAEISTIAEAESWRKEIYRPIYHIHKWWAKRLGSVFRSIILASAFPESSSILELFYQKNDLGGMVVYDPFMGGGTTIGEAVKLGCTAIGRDINPVAYNIVRAAFSPITKEDANRTFAALDLTVGEQIRALYSLRDGGRVLYYFWVKQVDCPECGTVADLFNSFIFSRNAYPSRKPAAQCFCPNCSGIFTCRYDSSHETCPSCHFGFNPQLAPAARTKSTCLNCGAAFSIVEAVRSKGVPPEHRLYAKMVLTPDGVKEYRSITEEDLAAYVDAAEKLALETPLIAEVLLEPGHNTDQAINYCYTRWEQFFNARQLLALSWLGRAIRDIENPELRLVFSILFSGILEFNNMFCSFKGEGTGAVRHMFSHHILKPERRPLEANVWGTQKSSGSFSTLFRSRILRAIEYRNAPFEVEVVRTGTKVKGGKKYDCNLPIPDDLHIAESAQETRPRSLYLSCGDSSHTDLPDRSVDLVITDPPFFDNVHYSELADFFYAWQLPLLGDAANGKSTTRDVREVQDRDSEQFSTKLAAVFAECHRVLKDKGVLAFTYHHSREEGWSSVAYALTAAGFRLVSAQPVKSEMSVAVPKKQAAEPIDLDIILVCRKAAYDSRCLFAPDIAYKRSMELAQEQIREFWRQGRRLSRNDIRVVLLSQLLVALSAGRTAGKLVSDFEEMAPLAQRGIEQVLADESLASATDSLGSHDLEQESLPGLAIMQSRKE